MNRFKLLPFLLLSLAAQAAELRLITEDDFHCKGRAGRSVDYRGKRYEDCAGGHLPEGGVNPKLLGVLNQFQARIGKRVVIASGYRCQGHNLYSWAYDAERTGSEKGVSLRSLHRAGAAADFYVEGVRSLRQYKKYARELMRHRGAGLIGARMWTRVYAADKVRDPDNQHDYPYIHIHVQGVEREAAPPEN